MYIYLRETLLCSLWNSIFHWFAWTFLFKVYYCTAEVKHSSLKMKVFSILKANLVNVHVWSVIYIWKRTIFISLIEFTLTWCHLYECMSRIMGCLKWNTNLDVIGVLYFTEWEVGVWTCLIESLHSPITTCAWFNTHTHPLLHTPWSHTYTHQLPHTPWSGTILTHYHMCHVATPPHPLQHTPWSHTHTHPITTCAMLPHPLTLYSTHPGPTPILTHYCICPGPAHPLTHYHMCHGATPTHPLLHTPWSHTYTRPILHVPWSNTPTYPLPHTCWSHTLTQ